MAGWTLSSPSNTVQKTDQSSSCDAASSQAAMGATFCFPISRLVFAKEVKVPSPKIAYHFQVRSAAFDPAEGESLVNKIIFRAPPHPVWVVGVKVEYHQHDRGGVGDKRGAAA